MDFAIPADIQATLDGLDEFIEREIVPLQMQDDNMRFFDHRREWARTDFEHDGVPRDEWEELLREMRRRADAAGWLRLALPAEFGGRDASNLEMAIIREHLAHKGLGLHNDLQNESSVVGNFPTVLMMRDFGTAEQIAEWMPGFLDGSRRLAFGLTEPNHGSDATFLETTAVRDGDEWVINGMKRWNTGVHIATHDIIFARTSGEPGSPVGITAFLVPCDAPGFKVEFYWWTLNMPSDHAEVSLTDVRVGSDAVFGRLDHGLELAQHFVHENRIRQAASSLGAAQYCIDEAVAYANQRDHVGQEAVDEPGHPVPARRAAHRGGDAAPADPPDGVAAWTSRATWRSPTRWRCATTGRTGSRATLPTGRCRPAAVSATRATCRSSTSTVTTAATGSPRAPRRSRCARSPSTSSASAGSSPTGSVSGNRTATRDVRIPLTIDGRGPASWST